MASNQSQSGSGGTPLTHTALYLACLAAALLWLFGPAFQPGVAHFSNDGPLAVQKAAYLAMPGAWTGVWGDISWLGWNGGTMFPHITSLILYLFGPEGYSKFLVPISQFIVGLCAVFCFRQFGFRPMVCALVGLAAALNMNFLSNSCWGLASRALQFAMVLLAVGAILSAMRRQTWLRLAFAGCALGMNVMEGADVGAIFSIYVALFAFFLFLRQQGRAVPQRAGRGVAGIAVLAGFAGLVAYSAVTHMINTQIKGVTTAPQAEQAQSPAEKAAAKRQAFEWATQWSLPKAEALRVAVPGLFGYRLDTEGGGAYWGSVGQQAGWEQHKQGFARHNGSGEYAGMLVVVIALWAAFQSFRRAGGPFQPDERLTVRFWSIAAVISLLLAFGRHAPFYQIVYALPYFSTIRNPMKFMHPFHLAVLILFGFGLQALSRLYLEKAVAWTGSYQKQLGQWWAALKGFDKRWAFGTTAVLGASLLAWLVYSSSRKNLVARLEFLGFPGDLGASLASFSIKEVALAILFLALTLGLLALIMSGCFSGARAKWAFAGMGLLLAVDLCRANSYWVQFYNYEEKYASNPVIDFLRDKPHERRVVVFPLNFGPDFGMFQQFYNIEWLQQHFVFYNIQSLDSSQQPRKPLDQAAYERVMLPNPQDPAGTKDRMLRNWQVTNTKLFFAPAGSAPQINQFLDPEKKRFRQVLAFQLVQRGERLFGAQTNTTGPFALLEFTGALPRVKLFTRFHSGLADDAVLKQLSDPAFDPEQSVLVSETIPAATADATAASNAQITSYAPKRIVVKTSASTPGVLLLNDRYDPAWRVSVDGKSQPLLRCNFIMRGVHLPAGEHEVVFEFKPSIRPLYVTLAGLTCWLTMAVVLTAKPRKTAPVSPAAPIASGPVKRP
jgi:hypothetical protein